jgi:hypothetical protein
MNSARVGMRYVIGVLGCAVLAAACGSAGAGSASSPSTTPPTPIPSAASVPESAQPSTTVKPFDPKGPIDLAGTPGVTHAEQMRAEKLLHTTITDLPKYDDPVAAQAAGYRSIGDAVTGDEHFVKWSYVDDGDILDPKKPESLVYEWRNGKQSLVAAMYMLPFGSHFTDIPDVGGALTQWHVHRDLCLTDDPEQKLVAGLTSLDGVCPAGTAKAGDTPMLHVWIVPNRCGPFAALEGVGAGQVPEGQTRLCDTAHGRTP